MFRKVNVPVLGIVENMSTFACPACGHESHIFGHGGARTTAAELDVPFLGEIPLDIAIRETSDSGAPITASAPESANAPRFRETGSPVWDATHGTAETRGGPRLLRSPDGAREG